MEIRGLKVVVIGAGIGGLAVARAFAVQGAQVTVLEQAVTISEVGAGLQISPNGMAVLRALNLDDTLKKSSVEANFVNLHDFRGGRVLQLDLERAARPGFHFVHRADLIDVLHKGARDAGVTILLLQRVREISQGIRPVVFLENGAKIEADLIVGADGLHSVLRPKLNKKAQPFFTGQIAWRALIPNTTDRKNDVRVFMGPHRHMVSYPLRGGRLMNIVAVQERAAWAAESWSQRDDPMAMKAAFDDFCPEARALLDQVKDVHLWGLFRHEVAKTWAKDGAALLGDAAHPTLPFMAQGACMALEDAWVMVDELSKAADLNSGLQSYQRVRETRVRKIVKTASGNARKYHLSFPPVRSVAHMALRLGGRVAPNLMVRQFDWIYGKDVTNPNSP